MMTREGNVRTPARDGKTLDGIATLAGRLSAPPNYFVFDIPELLADEFNFSFFAQKVIVDKHYRARLPENYQGRHSPISVYKDAVRSAPSLVHQHWATWSTPAVLVAKRLNVPLVLSMHGYDAFLPRTPGVGGPFIDLVKRRERNLAMTAAAAVVVNSSYMMDQVVTLGVPREKLHLIRHGVDTNAFRPRQGDRSGVLFVGRLSPEKGCATLVEALALSPREQYGHLTIVGDGDERTAIGKLAQGLNVPVQFLGSLDKRRVIEEMAGARLVVVPSVPRGTQQEASGLVPLEAQATGTPTVVTRVGGLPENVPSTLRELVAEPDSVDLARAIGYAFEADFTDISQRSREHVLAHHSMARVEREFRHLFRSLID